MKTKFSDKIGSFGFAEILDRIDNPKKYEEKAKAEEKEAKKEKLKDKLKTAANNNILKGGALLLAGQALKKQAESEEEEDENPFEEEDDEGGDESEDESEEVEDEEEEPEEEVEEAEEIDDGDDENNNFNRPIDGKLRSKQESKPRFQLKSDSKEPKHEANAAGADATTAETYGNQAESEDEERAFKTKGSKKAQENGAISFKIGLFEGSLDIDGDKYW